MPAVTWEQRAEDLDTIAPCKVLSDEGFARRVDMELDALGYPEWHYLRKDAQARFKNSTP